MKRSLSGTWLQSPPMRRIVFALAVFLAATLFAQTPSEPPMLGFSAANAAKERALEAQFDASLKRDDLREWMKRLSARPHHLGSPYDKENAEFIAVAVPVVGLRHRASRSSSVLFPTPKTRVRRDGRAGAASRRKLAEPPLAEDATSGQTERAAPDLQRLLDRRRRHRRSRLRQLRRARRTTRSSSATAST